MSSNKNEKQYMLLAFLIPSLILTFTFIIKKITPFGYNMLPTNDLEIQIVPFLTELSYKLKNSSSLLYSFRRVLGIDFFCESAYYLSSPLNVFCIFFTSKTMPIFISLLLVVKSGLCGLTMNIYLSKHFKSLDKNVSAISLAFSSCYALCSYLTEYYLIIMWFDVMIMLPLVILCLENLINTNKPYLYSIVLAISIITNFYVGFMVCIFCVLYFIYYIAVEANITSKKGYLSSTISFFVYSSIGGAMAAFILLPLMYSLGRVATLNSSNHISLADTSVPLIQLIYGIFFNCKPRFLHTPNLYSGIIVSIFACYYLFNKEIKLRKKIGNSILILVILSSFYFKFAEYIWNGMHVPNGYNGRNAFIFSFLIIKIAYESFISAKNPSKYWWYSFITLFLLIFNAISNAVIIFSLTETLGLNLLFICIYTLICVTHFKKSTSYTTPILVFIVIIELTLSCYYSRFSYDGSMYIDSNKTNTEVINRIKQLDNSIESSPYKIINQIAPNANSECLYCYNGLSTISSMSNGNLDELLSNKGLFSGLNSLNAPSFEPVLYSILGVKYIISPDKFNTITYLEDFISNGSYYVYENPYTISLGFLPKDPTYLTKLSSDNPFQQINNFAKNYNIGSIYKEYQYQTNLLENKSIIDITPGNDIYLYSKESFTDTTFRSFGMPDFKLYNNSINNAFIQTNIYTNNYVLNIPNSILGGTIEIPSTIDTSKLIIYSFDINNYVKLMNKLKETELHITTFKDTYVKGYVNLDSSGQYMCLIPYSEGWSVFIDGKKIDTRTTSNVFLSFNITEGKHTIELKYCTPNLYMGCCISLLAISILILLCIYKSKTNKTNSVIIH